MQDIYTSTFHYSKGMWGHVVDCYVSVFCQYLRPIADILPGHCPCQEEVYTQGGSCPGWPYLEQQDKYHNKMWNKAKPRKRTHCKNLQRNHQIPFSAQLVILEVNMNVQLYSLFQEAHFAWQLLPLFVLIDKKLPQFFIRGNFWEPKQVTHLQDQTEKAGCFFSLQMMTNMLFSNSRNHPILPPLNTQAWM